MGLYDLACEHKSTLIKQSIHLLFGRTKIIDLKITSGSNFMFKRILNNRSSIVPVVRTKKDIKLRKNHTNNEKFNMIESNKKSRIGKLVIQKHDASHKHYDISIIDGKKEIFRGAVTKKEIANLFPKTINKPTSFVRQPQHDLKYLLKTPDKFKIPEGEYGAGTVERVFNESIEIHKTEKGRISFSVYEKSIEGHYAIFETKSNTWMCARRKDPVVGQFGRGKFKVINDKKAIMNESNRDKNITSKMKTDIDKFIKDNKYVAEEKCKGGNNYLRFGKKENVIWSHRVSKRNNGPILHQNRYDELRDELHPELNDTEVRGELVFVQGRIGKSLGKFFQPHGVQMENQIARFSNIKNPIQSRTVRKTEPGNVGYVIWDIHKYKGKNVEHLSYGEKTDLIDSITKKCKHMYSPRRWNNYDKAWEQIVKKEGGEGIVIKKLNTISPQPDINNGKYWLKVKNKDYTDVRITNWKPTYKITGKIDDTMIGEFTVKDKSGKELSCPATGMTHWERKWCRNNIEQILKDNSIIRVSHEGETSKSILKPVYNSVHGEKTEGILNEMAIEKYSSDNKINKYLLKGKNLLKK